MNRALRKNAFVEIFKTKSRFLSIFSIVAIGIAFFAGVKNTAPDMKNSADSYYKSLNLAHYRLISTLGFTEEDIAALNSLEGITVYPGYFTDVIVKNGEEDEIVRVMSLSEYKTNSPVNSLELTDGRFPENENECIADSGGLVTKRNVGDTLIMLSGGDSEISDTLKVTEYTIVGTFNSPAYIDMSSRGSTNIGNGSISSIVYIPEENFDVEVYTELYLTADRLKSLNAYSEDFDKENERITKLLETVGENREIERYDEILSEANEEIEKAEKELADAKADAEKELSDAKKELDNALKEIEDGEKDLAEAKKTLDEAKTTLADSRDELDEGWDAYYNGVDEFNETIDKAKVQLAEQRRQLDDGYTQYTAALEEYNKSVEEYNSGNEQYKAGLAQYEEGYGYYSLLNSYYQGYITIFELARNLGVELPDPSGVPAGYSDSVSVEAGRMIGGINEPTPDPSAETNGIEKAYGTADFPELTPNQDPTDSDSDTENGATDNDSENEDIWNSGAETEEPVITAPIEETAPNPIATFLLSIPSREETAAMMAQLAQTKEMLDATSAELNSAAQQLTDAGEQLKQTGESISNGYAQLEEAEKTLETETQSNQQTLNNSYAKLQDGERQYEEGVEEYRQGEIDYAKGVVDLQEGRDKYNDGLKEYEEGKAEADSEIADAERKIRDAKRDLQDLENPTWYVFDRDSNPGYSEYGENAERINNIASVFPVFFILVAGLVCLTTMTRMVEEQRSQIGTLKALGYTNGQIIFKFMLYALTATLLGSLVGAVAGQKLFPIVIIKAYAMMYTMSEALVPTDWLLTAGSTLVAAAAVAATVYLSCKSELSEQPAILMRPKAPRAGKKILLDKLPVWKKVGFNGKVTARNLFRYKRRMMMTVVGIAGCTMLTLTGFALEDSISGIINNQYNELVLYDGFFAYESVDEGDTRQIEAVAEKNNCDTVKYLQKKFNIASPTRTVDAYLTVPEDKEAFCDLFVFRDRKSKEPLEFFDDRVLIDEKLSTLLDIKAGDNAEIYVEGEEHNNVNISGCVENYPNHYIYMSRDMYAELFGEEPEYNIMAFKERNGDVLTEEKEQERFASELLSTNAVLSVNFKDDLITTMSNMLNALNSVVGVLIISAGALAFVVLYNLTNINITERIREIATLKVMGFYDREVDNYIFREIIILTLMGIAVGLFGGVFFAMFVIETTEIDLVMFGRDISVMSFVYSGLITLAFSIIVVIYMHSHLKKVDMIEALKSVE